MGDCNYKEFLSWPGKDQENTAGIVERFKDTFTKLRAFEIYRLGFIRAVFLDADMAIFRNPDEIFKMHAPSSRLVRMEQGEFAYTPLTHRDEVAAEITLQSRPTYRLLNGGMLLFYLGEQVWNKILQFFNTTDRLKSYQFPDQDFLADLFRDKLYPLSWKYNALKIMRYRHPRIWSDDKMVVLHYFVDKPWERQVSSDGIAGHLGRDGETHQWWGNIYQLWRTDREKVIPMV